MWQQSKSAQHKGHLHGLIAIGLGLFASHQVWIACTTVATRTCEPRCRFSAAALRALAWLDVFMLGVVTTVFWLCVVLAIVDACSAFARKQGLRIGRISYRGKRPPPPLDTAIRRDALNHPLR